MKLTHILSFSLIIISLQGCGGSSDDDAGNTTSTLSGTAATGAAIIGQVKITGSKGKSVVVTIDDAGNYQATVTSLSPPFIISATPTDTTKDTQYSFSAKVNSVANITPLTTLALFEANGKGNLDTLIATWASNFNNISQNVIDAQKAIINANFQAIMTANGIDSTLFDIFTSVFNADSNGFDAVLDLINFSVNFNSGLITITIPSAPAFSFNANINATNNGSTQATTAGTLSITGGSNTVLGFSSIDLLTFPSQSSSTNADFFSSDTIVWNKIIGSIEYRLTVTNALSFGTRTVLNVIFQTTENGVANHLWTSVDIETGIDIQNSQVVFNNVSMDATDQTTGIIISGTLTR